jgi:maltodextrin utilization protein YvdJ
VLDIKKKSYNESYISDLLKNHFADLKKRIFIFLCTSFSYLSMLLNRCLLSPVSSNASTLNTISLPLFISSRNIGRRTPKPG